MKKKKKWEDKANICHLLYYRIISTEMRCIFALYYDIFNGKLSFFLECFFLSGRCCCCIFHISNFFASVCEMKPDLLFTFLLYFELCCVYSNENVFFFFKLNKGHLNLTDREDLGKCNFWWIFFSRDTTTSSELMNAGGTSKKKKILRMGPMLAKKKCFFHIKKKKQKQFDHVLCIPIDSEKKNLQSFRVGGNTYTVFARRSQFISFLFILKYAWIKRGISKQNKLFISMKKSIRNGVSIYILVGIVIVW